MTRKLIPTTKEKYEEMLEILPPIDFNGESFLVGEPVTHRNCAISGYPESTYDGYVFRDKQYWVTDTDVTRREFSLLKSEAKK